MKKMLMTISEQRSCLIQGIRKLGKKSKICSFGLQEYVSHEDNIPNMNKYIYGSFFFFFFCNIGTEKGIEKKNKGNMGLIRNFFYVLYEIHKCRLSRKLL